MHGQERKRRLAFLSVIPPAEAKPYLDALLDGLRELGWVEGRNLIVDVRYTQGVATQFPAASAERLALKPDVFLAASDLAAKAAAAPVNPPPVVFAVGSDPVGNGLVRSLAQPGIGATGFSAQNFELVGKRMDLLKQAVPALTTVGVLGYKPNDIAQHLVLSQLLAAGRKLGADPPAASG